jgi:predicted PurR-regulated permease PerM
LHKLSAVLVPMAFALILAYILSPVVDHLVKQRRMKRLWAVSLVFAVGGALALTIIGSVLPDLKSESSRLVHELTGNVGKARTKAQRFAEDSKLGQQLPTSWRRALIGPTDTITLSSTDDDTVANADTNAIPASAGANELKPEPEQPFSASVLPAVSRGLLWIAEWFTSQLKKVTTWVEFLVGFILVPVYLFYFLLEKDAITSRWTDYLPLKESEAKDEVIFVLRSINECMIVFFRGQVLVAMCVGVLLTIGYLVMGLNYAVMLGVVAGVLGIVPYLGTITSLILALTVAGVQFGDWTHPLIVLGIAGTVKLLEDFLISPKIIGERSGLHPLTIILAVMIGTTLLGGFIGALLAIPLTATLRTLMFRYIWNRSEHKHGASEAAEEKTA